MFRVLVPVDGSENSLRAVERAIVLVRDRKPFELHLLNVQPPVSGSVTTFVGTSAIKDYHREEGEKAMAAARALLDLQGVPYQQHVTVGPLGESISGFARQLGVEQIVMGTRGMGKIAGALLGSVSTEVIRHADVPVTLVK